MAFLMLALYASKNQTLLVKRYRCKMRGKKPDSQMNNLQS